MEGVEQSFRQNRLLFNFVRQFTFYCILTASFKKLISSQWTAEANDSAVSSRPI